MTFKDCVPGNDWYFSFMKHNPRLSLKKVEHLQKSTKLAPHPEIVYDFYYVVEKLFWENNITDDKVFSCDETGLSLTPAK